MTMTEYIKDDLRAIIHQEEELPSRLTLSALSKHYGVSLTPVRLAVEDLVAEGVIFRKDNGRLEPGKADNISLPKSEQKPPLQARQEDLVETIKREVVKRSLQGDTSYLREQAFAEKWGAGRTVVRQILSSLAGGGLLEHVPRCGWRVRPFSEKDMHDFLEIREIMELKALKLAWPKLDEAELRQLQSGNKPATGRRQSMLNDDLHDYWISRSDNRYIQEFFSRYGVFYSTLFNSVVMDEKTRREMAHEHYDIIECLINDDLRGAKKELSSHIREQRDNVSRMISQLHDE